MTERFELARQLRRASISIAANIAEGAGRKHAGDYARFLSIARGSQAEVETLLEIIRRLGFVAAQSLEAATGLAGEVGRMLTVMLGRRLPNQKPSP
jgi:four helix bundle protein